MTQFSTGQSDGTANAGRKGMAYDWQTLLASAEAASLDHELTHVTSQLTQRPAG